MKYIEVESDAVPVSLLLEADPSESHIRSYLSDSWCFVAKESDVIVGASIVKPSTNGQAELFNISILPEFQSKGIGTGLLKFTLAELSLKGVQRVELGTGSFGYQLTYYQRLGFRVGSVVKDHFLTNYSEPIFEHGIQHKDMLRLYVNL